MKKYFLWGANPEAGILLRAWPKLAEKITVIDNYKDALGEVKTHRAEVLKQERNKEDILITIFARVKEKEIREIIEFEYEIDPGKIVSHDEWMLDILLNNNDMILQPYAVRLDASTLCQLDCADCYMRKTNYGTVGAGYLTYENFKKFVEENSFVKHIELSNSGEPFLNPDMKKIITLSQKKSIDLSFGNGCNLNYVADEVLEEVVASGCVKVINVSIDGATQEVYEKYRRKGNLETVFDNIRKINMYKEKYNSVFPEMNWQYILFEHNQDEVLMAKNIAESLGMKISYKLDWGKGFEAKDPEFLEAVTGIKWFSRNAYKEETGKNYKTVCSQLMYMPQFNWDGRLLGCCAVYQSDWGENVFEKSLLEILNGKKFKETIIALLGGPAPKQKTPCTECSMMKQYLDDRRGFHMI